MPGKIFINYRRDDSIGTAGRLHDRLVQAFGRANVFMDVDHIPAGVDFVRHLNSQVAECDVFLAVIGPGWLDTKDSAGGRKLDNPEDFVRVELLAALGRDVRVIPVLVDGARMPKPDELPEPLRPLSRRHAVDVRNVQFGSDVERLISKVGDALGGRRPAMPIRWPMAAAGVAALLVVGSIGVRQVPPQWLPWKWEEQRKKKEEERKRIAIEEERARKAQEDKRLADAIEKARKEDEARRAAALAAAKAKEEEDRRRAVEKANRWVQVNNHSYRYSVRAIYAVPSIKNMRIPITGQDWIPKVTIGPRQGYNVNFDDGKGTCVYDLRATKDPAGPDWVRYEFNVCVEKSWDLPD